MPDCHILYNIDTTETFNAFVNWKRLNKFYVLIVRKTIFKT